MRIRRWLIWYGDTNVLFDLLDEIEVVEGHDVGFNQVLWCMPCEDEEIAESYFSRREWARATQQHPVRMEAAFL